MTPRRWLAVANPSLSAVLDEHLGRNWRTDLSLLNDLQQHCDFPMVNHAVHQAKLENKKRLAEYIAQQLNVVVNPKALFDVQNQTYSRIQTSIDECVARDHPL